jgi:hypothetical protein
MMLDELDVVRIVIVAILAGCAETAKKHSCTFVVSI